VSPGPKSATRLPDPGCPHLGFNPAPGCTDTVRELHRKLANCAEALEEAVGIWVLGLWESPVNCSR
jgi:hypothetical protein